MSRLRSFVLALLFAILMPLPLHAATDPGLTVDIPELTRVRTITVRGQTVPGSDVAVGPFKTKADAAGLFQAQLDLTSEGVNGVTVTANTPEGKVFTWSGSTELDTQAPRIVQLLPDVTNQRYFKVTGRTEVGARVEVNGKAVPADAGGYFSTWVSLDLEPTVKQVVTDSAGNQTVVEKSITVVKTAPQYQTWVPYVAAVGSAKAGTKITNATDPDAPVIIVEQDEQFRWIEHLDLGWKDLWLKFEPATGAPYYHFYQWHRPVDIEFPAQTNLSRITLPGQLFQGWRMTINNESVTADAEGRFTFTTELKIGDNDFQVILFSPEGASYNYSVRINRTSWSVATGFQDGMWMFTLVDPPGYRYSLRGHPEVPQVVMGPEGRIGWPIKVVPGLNRVSIDFMRTNSSIGLLYYEFTYNPGRVVKMQLEHPTMFVNSEEQTLTVPPKLIDGNTYVPLRPLADALGAKLTWDGATRSALFELGSKRLSVTLDSYEAKVNGNVVPMIAPALLVSDRTMVPLRFISENLGAQVKWDGATRSITITLP